MKTLRWLAACAACVAASHLGLPAQQAASTKAFTGLRLIDGTNRGPIINATILVRDGRIVAVGPAASVPMPPVKVIRSGSGAERSAMVTDGRVERISLAGKTVMPGLINAHGHVGDTVGLEGGHYSAEKVAADLTLYANYGVTTVFSLGGDQAAGFAARNAQRMPTLTRARLFVAGPVLAPKTPDDARKQVAEVEALKADIVKIRVDDNLGSTAKMTPEVYRAVIDEAHKRGLRVAVHLFYLADAKAVLDAGADFVAHSIRDADVDDAVIAALKKRDVCVCPTLMREVSTFIYESTPTFFADRWFLKYADPQVVEKLKDPARQQAMRNSASAQRYKLALEVASRNLKKLSDAGVTIAMGTDTGPPARFQGYFEQMELELMAKAGLTPRQILASATRDAARCMKIENEVGTLETGKWADFVVLNADPLADIKNTRSIDSVWIAGNRVSQ